LAGLYLHIPFCKQACHYCDFHFSTNRSNQEAMVAAMVQEIKWRHNYLPEKSLQTIYFGGGTPSLLPTPLLAALLEAIHQTFDTSALREVTLEANPDDLNPAVLQAWYDLGIRRLSVGIQSFNEQHLRYLNRAHDAAQALRGVDMARRVGFEAFSIDLIYAIPAESHRVWEADLAQALALDVSHISAYCLTIEERTVFGNRLAKGLMAPIPDQWAATQFEMLTQALGDAGYEHYEISNFARQGRYAIHNTAYWQMKPYIGIGPGAHAFDGQNRHANVANNARYIRSILQENTLPATLEVLSPADRANELLLVGLRTQWGVSVAALSQLLGQDWYIYNQTTVEAHLAQAWLEWTADGQRLRIPPQARLLADHICATLFVD
jgi:oxygen-independent coproporphyrinogen-3 oxidase